MLTKVKSLDELETISIDYNGPDGTWLVLQGDALGRPEGYNVRLQLNDELLEQLDKALQPWREHRAEGERIRAEFERHKGRGLCTHWIDGVGPCSLLAGHKGEHYRVGS